MSPPDPHDPAILIVDDQETNLLLLERILKQGGYARFRSVADPRQAVAAFCELQPDLVLLDLTMPYLDGVAVMGQLRPLAGDVYLPIVVLTADVSPEAKQRALSAGATDFLTKPIDAVEVLLRIRNLLKTRFLYRQIQWQADRRVQAAVKRMEHVVATSRAVLFTLEVENDRIQRISWMSENANEMLGYRPEETYTPVWWLERIHPDDLPSVIERARVLFAAGRISDEYRFRHHDGSYRWLQSDKRVLRTAPGERVEIVGSWIDVTERKLLEDQYRQAQKMEAVGRLAGGVAHDFNNLLTVIIGYSEVLLAEATQDVGAQSMIEEVRKAGARAALLTRQLLAFSRKQMLKPEVLDLNALVRDTGNMLRRLIGEDIALVERLDPDLGRVKADPGQLEQVLMNLIVNARDAMPEGGEVAIETRNASAAPAPDGNPEGTVGPCVMLAVSDTGCGMTPEVKARIFEPFFTTKEEGKGTGLGLATVYGIVKQSNGSIDVESEPGRGTTFTIRLPRLSADDGALERGNPGIRVLPSGSGTILLVEDEPSVRTLGSLALRSAGYAVLEAGNGEEALTLAQKRSPIDLLVTDVVMPKMNGRDLAGRITAVDPGVKVLFMSGYTDDTLRRGIRESGVPFLQKPFTPATLARKVRDVLGH